MEIIIVYSVFSGLGYIVGSRVAEAFDDWRWALRVSRSRYSALLSNDTYCTDMTGIIGTATYLNQF